MRQRLSYLMVISLCLSLTISGCGLQDLLGNKKKSSSSSQSDSKKSFIAVSLKENDPNQALIKSGLEDMAGKSNMQIKYLSADGTQAGGKDGAQSSGDKGGSQSSGDKQDSQAGAEEESLKGAKVLIYQGGDPGILQAAQAKKIPVLAIGQIPSGSKPSGLILPDQEKVGELMGQALVSKLQEGNVVILQADAGENGAQERLAGMRAVLSKYPKLTLQIIQGQAGTESVAKQNFLEYLQKNPAKVQAVLADTETMAAQAAEVLKQTQMPKKPLLIGGQANVESLKRMASGIQAGDVDVAPYLQGVNAYQWAQMIAKNEPLDVNDSVTSDQGEIPAKVVPVKPVSPVNLAIMQKSYEKALSIAEAEKKAQAAQKSKPGSSSDSKDQSGSSDSGQSKDQAGKQSSSSGSSGGGANMPAGVKKVTEHVKTIITREYLDAQGKVIGTESNSTEQVRTVPPEMLQQEQKQAENKTQEQSGQSSDQKSSDQKSSDQQQGQ